MPDYDILVVGGGHNGLTAAAYFATCGYSTVVVEKNPQVGGGVVTKELMPGVRQDLHSMVHFFTNFNPMIKDDEIGLQRKFGLNYIRQDQQLGSAWLDGSSLLLYKELENTLKSIEKLSKNDARNYRKFIEWATPLIEQVLGSMFEPPPPMGTSLTKMESTPGGREMIQLTFANIVDLVDEWFEDPHLQAAFVKTGGDWGLCDPRLPGSAMFLLGELVIMHQTGFAIPKGGSGELSESLARCIKDNGGDIVLNSLVTEIIVTKGVATGIKTDDGRIINARKAIVGDLNIKQLPKLCGEDNFDSEYLRQVRRISHGFSAGQVEWVLSDYPKFSANPDVAKSYGVRLAESVVDALKIYDGITYGRPQWTQPWITVATLIDSSRAPPGVHTLNMWLPNPYDLADGGAQAWDRIKDDVAQKAYQNLRDYCPNMTDDKVLHRYFHSPLDFERWNPAMMKGDENHIAHIANQTGSYRPLPGYGDFKTPIERLYLCGPSTNIGGGVTGQSRAAVKAIMGYLGQDFNRLLADSRKSKAID